MKEVRVTPQSITYDIYITCADLTPGETESIQCCKHIDQSPSNRLIRCEVMDKKVYYFREGFCCHHLHAGRLMIESGRMTQKIQDYLYDKLLGF